MREVFRRHGKHIALLAGSLVVIVGLTVAPVLALAGNINHIDVWPSSATQSGRKWAHAVNQAGKLPAVLGDNTEGESDNPALQPSSYHNSNGGSSNENHHHDDNDTPPVTIDPPMPEPPQPEPIPVPMPMPEPKPYPIPYPQPCGGCPGPMMYQEGIRCPMTTDTMNYMCRYELEDR